MATIVEIIVLIILTVCVIAVITYGYNNYRTDGRIIKFLSIHNISDAIGIIYTGQLQAFGSRMLIISKSALYEMKSGKLIATYPVNEIESILCTSFMFNRYQIQFTDGRTQNISASGPKTLRYDIQHNELPGLAAITNYALLGSASYGLNAGASIAWNYQLVYEFEKMLKSVGIKTTNEHGKFIINDDTFKWTAIMGIFIFSLFFVVLPFIVYIDKVIDWFKF